MIRSRGVRCSAAVAALGVFVALSASPVASAATVDAHRLVVPAGVQGGELLGSDVAGFISRPVSEEPPACVAMAGGRVLRPVESADCSAPLGTQVLVLPFWNACSNIDPPYSSDPAIQRECAAGFDRDVVKAERVTVDKGPTVDIRQPLFETFSPQRYVQLPADNVFGVDPNLISFSAHAWLGMVRGLAVGRHTIHVDLVLDFGLPTGPETFPTDATVTILKPTSP